MLIIDFEYCMYLPTGKMFYLGYKYIFKANNRNIRRRLEISWKLTTETPERHQWGRSGVVIINIFQNFFWCFYCWLCISKRLLSTVFVRQGCTIKRRNFLAEHEIWLWIVSILCVLINSNFKNKLMFKKIYRCRKRSAQVKQ